MEENVHMASVLVDVNLLRQQQAYLLELRDAGHNIDYLDGLIIMIDAMLDDAEK